MPRWCPLLLVLLFAPAVALPQPRSRWSAGQPSLARPSGPRFRLPARRASPPSPPRTESWRERLSPSAIRQAAVEAPDNARRTIAEAPEKIRQGVLGVIAAFNPAVFAAGFASAILVIGTLTTFVANEATEFLSESGRGEVLERALLFGAILGDVKEAYVDRQAVDLDELFDTGVNAMLATLDPYTTYEDAAHAEDLSTRTTGRYGGIGITIGADDSDGSGRPSVLVLSALEGYAYDAGVRPGDRILSVDGHPVTGVPVDEVKTLLRGEPGTSVTLALQRDGALEKRLDIEVPRKEVRLPDVSLATVLAPHTGYVKLDGFSEGTAEELAINLIKLYETGRAVGEPINSLVLDLRDNPGGLLDAAVGVAQLLVPKGTDIVSTEGRVYGEGATLNYRSIYPPLVPASTRLVVLVNGNTASAAEIVTGVVQDTDRGVVVGEKTFGKGLVQVVEPLPGGRSLKLTVAKYFTPSGRCIQAVSYAKPRKANTMAAVSPSKQTPGGTSMPLPQQPQQMPPTDGKPTSAAPTMPSSTAIADTAAAGDESRASVTGRETFTERSMRAGEIFTTKNGREVKTGGGIAPDVQAAAKPVGVLERSLLRQGAFFHFAGWWLSQHEGSPSDQAAVLTSPRGTDEAYREFVAFARERYLTKHPPSSTTAASTFAPLDPRSLPPVPGSGAPPVAAPHVGNTDDATEDDDIGLWQVQDRSLAEPLRQLERALVATGDRPRSASGLRALRKTLAAEELAQFETQRSVLAKDVRDAVLARLLPPSQVREALAVVNDPTRYSALLAPPTPPTSIFPPSNMPQTVASSRPPSTVSSGPMPSTVSPMSSSPAPSEYGGEVPDDQASIGMSPIASSRNAAAPGYRVSDVGIRLSNIRRA